MTILIAKRGNINGQNSELENSPDYLKQALDEGYNVECDLWFKDNNFWLGHDQPQYMLPDNFIDERFWIHCKNIYCMEKMLAFNNHLNFFWHEKDHLTLTSLGYAWVYPGRRIPKYKGIAVCPEKYPDWDISKAFGICSDTIMRYVK